MPGYASSAPPCCFSSRSAGTPTGRKSQVNPSQREWTGRRFHGPACVASSMEGQEKAMTMRIYGDSISGNCLKVKWTCDALGLTYDWIETSVLTGETRTEEFLLMNPAGQVPLAIAWPMGGRPLAESNAIILHLAEGSALIPADAYARARMLQWLFWEQYSHEPYIAVARFQMKYLGKVAGKPGPEAGGSRAASFGAAAKAGGLADRGQRFSRRRRGQSRRCRTGRLYPHGARGRLRPRRLPSRFGPGSVAGGSRS